MPYNTPSTNINVLKELYASNTNELRMDYSFNLPTELAREANRILNKTKCSFEEARSSVIANLTPLEREILGVMP
jgi:hypothetical protein